MICNRIILTALFEPLNISIQITPTECIVDTVTATDYRIVSSITIILNHIIQHYKSITFIENYLM